MNLVNRLSMLAKEADQYLHDYIGYPVMFADPASEDFHEAALDLPDYLLTQDYGHYDEFAIYGLKKDKHGLTLLVYNKETGNTEEREGHELGQVDNIYLAQYLGDWTNENKFA